MSLREPTLGRHADDVGPRRRSAGEAGVATVLAIVWIVVITTAGWIGMLAAAIAAAQHHLDGASDLAAVSAALSAQAGDDPCAAATRIADGNGVGLRDCLRDGGDVVVTLVDSVRLPFGIDGTITATARAGP